MHRSLTHDNVAYVQVVGEDPEGGKVHGSQQRARAPKNAVDVGGTRVHHRLADTKARVPHDVRHAADAQHRQPPHCACKIKIGAMVDGRMSEWLQQQQHEKRRRSSERLATLKNATPTKTLGNAKQRYSH
jgi:hypothetical protein